MLIYKYSQIADEDRLSYEESLKLCKNKVIHLGQLKLFFSELIFLSLHANPGDLVLYIGAAPGIHIGKLAELFPTVQFDLWDPRKFEVDTKPNIKIFKDYFTDDTARAYRTDSRRILLMCDLRTLRIGHFKRTGDIEAMDELVDDDMRMQSVWCQIINPYYAYLKFRLPYEVPKTKYLTGTIYLQPYSKISTEARLMTNNYTNFIQYDNKIFEEKLAYHNGKTRCHSIKYKKWSKIMDKYSIKNNWDNALALHITQLYLNICNKFEYQLENSLENVGVLFMDIIKYHKNKSGEKYSVIFN